MKILRFVPFCLFALSASAGSLESFIGPAQALQGEFSSEALIRIAGARELAPARRMELLELAFDRAGAAREPYKRRPIGLRVQAASGYAGKVYLQDMDALSLRLRAVEAMLPLDAGRARALFGRIPPIVLPRLKCQDAYVYDVSRFYDVLAELTGPEPGKLLERYAAVTAPEQAGPMARLIAASGLPDAEFSAVLSVYSKALGRIEASDRAFSSARLLGRDIQALAAECARRKIPALGLLENYRVYLVIHLSSERCADDETLGGVAVFMSTPTAADLDAVDMANFFNKNLRQDPLKPIEESDSTPTRLEGTAAMPRLCESAGCRAFAAEYKKLLLGANGQPVPAAARETTEWATQLRAALSSLPAWKPETGEDPGFQFLEKASAYSQLVGIAPAGETRDLVLHGLLDFLEKNPLRDSRPAEWFLPVNALIGRTTLDPAGLAGIAEAMRKSPDPVIALFAGLEQAAPRSPDRILPLL